MGFDVKVLIAHRGHMQALNSWSMITSLTVLSCNLSPRVIWNYCIAIKISLWTFPMPTMWMQKTLVSNCMRALHIQVPHISLGNVSPLLLYLSCDFWENISKFWHTILVHSKGRLKFTSHLIYFKVKCLNLFC